MTPAPRRPSLAAGLATLAVVAVGVAGAVALSRPLDAPSPARSIADPRPVVDAAASQVAVADAATSPAVVSVDVATQPARAPGQAEVCGLGLVATSAADPDGGARIDAATRNAASSALQTALAQSTDPRAQAAGLLLRTRTANDTPTSADAAADASAALADLAGRAAQADDPAVVAVALAACDHAPSPAPAACAAVDPGRWAGLEPTNAAPWLRIAQRARDAGDDAALAAAIYQVSIARGIDWHADDVALAAMQAIPADAPPLARTLAARAIAQGDDTWAGPVYGGLVAWCAPGVDANRDAICDASARLLLRPSARMYETRLGARMGRSLGWDPARLDGMNLRREALLRAQAAVPEAADPYACGAANRLQQRIAARQRLGETAAGRAELADAGRDLASVVGGLRTLHARRVARLEAAGATSTDAAAGTDMDTDTRPGTGGP